MDWRFCHPLCKQQLNLTGLIGLTAGEPVGWTRLGLKTPSSNDVVSVGGIGIS
jgi:hypothetical protein